MPKKILLKTIFNKIFFKFILGGIVNTLISSFFLFFLLNFLTVFMSTLFSDILYALNAYFINSRGIFKKKGVFLKYLLFIFISWLIKYSLLERLLDNNINKLKAVILITPLFALGSYLSQRYIVFK